MENFDDTEDEDFNPQSPSEESDEEPTCKKRKSKVKKYKKIKIQKIEKTQTITSDYPLLMEIDEQECLIIPLNMFRMAHMKHIVEGFRKAMKSMPPKLPITISFSLEPIVFRPLFEKRGIPHQFATTDIAVVNTIIPEYVYVLIENNTFTNYKLKKLVA